VHYSLLDTALPNSEDGYTSIRPDGFYSAFAIALTGEDVSVFVCGGGAGTNPQSGQPFVNIEVKSPSYAQSSTTPDGGLPLPLTAGSYAIGFEDVPDPDLTMTSSLALLWVGTFPQPPATGATLVASAYSGTVTLTTVEPGHVVGSFDVELVEWTNGSFDITNMEHFSGTFDTTPCPGTVQ
jgi:hypothetical protein